MRLVVALMWVAMGSGLSGCVPSYRFTRTTRLVTTPKPVNCAFELYTTRPDRPFDEVGVLEGGLPASDARGFFRAVRPHVCRVGGDGVLTEINGQGVYVRGTVIRFRE